MPECFEDHYAILSVSPSASHQAIKQAYRQKVKFWHPDRNSHPNATQEFQRIQFAYELLSDKTRRQTYDRCRGEQKQQPNYYKTAQKTRTKEYETPVYDEPIISRRSAQRFSAIGVGGFVAWIVWVSLFSKMIVVPNERNVAELGLYPTAIFPITELMPTTTPSFVAVYPTATMYVAVIAVPTQPSQLIVSCPDSGPTRFITGQRGYTLNRVNLRASPSGATGVRISAGVSFEVIGEPICATLVSNGANLLWLPVRLSESGRSGWIAESIIENGRIVYNVTP